MRAEPGEVDVSVPHSHPKIVFGEQTSFVLKLAQSVAPDAHRVDEHRHDDATAGVGVVSSLTGATVRAEDVVLLLFCSVPESALVF